jgi:hypothetical protein
MKHTTQTPYQSPELEFVEVTVEMGFANSMEDPKENDEMDW